MYASLQSGAVRFGNCVPSNDTLSGPLAGPLETLIGAANGLMPWIITGVVVILSFVVVLTLRSDKAAGKFKMIALVLIVPILVWFGLMIYFVVSGNLVQVDACPF